MRARPSSTGVAACGRTGGSRAKNSSGATPRRGTREDVGRYLGYLEALYAAVRDGMLAGKILETLQAEIRLPEYADLRMYDEWLPLNVEGVYETLVETGYLNFRSDPDAEF